MGQYPALYRRYQMNPWRQSSGQSSGSIVLAQVTGV
jgi:hypothetical protein